MAGVNHVRNVLPRTRNTAPRIGAVLLVITAWPAFATQTTVVSGLSSPEGIAVDSKGSLYVAQSNIQQVLKEILANGKYT
jgi:hypothetical protein